MASRFSGGSADFYGGARSLSASGSQSPYRSQLAGIFLDQNSQIPSGAVGPKRTLADFQAQQQQLPNPGLNAFLFRSVKPRTLPHAASPFPLPHVPNDLSFLGSASAVSQRYGVPVAQLRSQPVAKALGFQTNNPNQNHYQAQLAGSGSSVNPVQSNHEAEKMMNRLKELEKELLDDDEGDAGSVITNTNSEWSETIQSLVGAGPTQSPSQNPLSSSSPSSSSSSSSSSAASPASACSRQTIMEAANAVSECKNDIAGEIISRACQSLNPKASAEQRVMESVLAGLKSRLNPVESPSPVLELYGKEHMDSTQLLYELSPCFKLGFMAANLAILEATLGQNGNNTGFHVIDFDVGQEGQYENLLRALSARKIGETAVVKITALADGDDERSRTVGDNLTQLGERLGVRLKFKVVRRPRLVDLSRDSLGCEPDEPIAVNLAFNLYRVPDESVSTENPRDELLRRVKSLSPRVVTLVEHEMNGNTAPFVARVGENCSYYGSLFESIDSTVPRDNPSRVRVEQGLSRRIVNSVAREGCDRVERCEVFGKWRARMGMAGFELMPLSQGIAESIRVRLSSGGRVHPGFSVRAGYGGVCFGWKGRTLTVASSWR